MLTPTFPSKDPGATRVMGSKMCSNPLGDRTDLLFPQLTDQPTTDVSTGHNIHLLSGDWSGV